LRRAQARDSLPGRRGALAARHEQFPGYGDGRGARQRLRKAPDDGGRAPGRVDGLDEIDRLAGVRAGDGLAAERVDLPVQGGHGRVAHRHWQRGDSRVGPAAGGRDHPRVWLASVVAADKVGRGADGDGLGVGARRGKGTEAGGAAPASERECLDRPDRGR
jgi:hypothetical protein